MSKRKGVSADEKRTRMLQIFYEKKDVFLLKELEKIAPKEKGIVAQSVKDVLQLLVDDGLVEDGKIGTSIYYWSFPSKAVNNKKRKITDLENKLEEAQKKFKVLEEKIKVAQHGREESNERETTLKDLEEKKVQLKNIQSEVQKYSECDPEVLDELKKQIIVSKEAANRWTDNIFSIKSWCKNKFFIEESALNKQFGIPEEFDYIE